MSETTDPAKQRAEQLTEFLAEDRIDRGVPDVGAESKLEVEDFRDAFIDGALEKLANLPVEQSEGVEYDTHPMDVTDPENFVRLYLTDPPWQAPVVVLECKELPEYAKITTTESVWIRPNPGLSGKETWARFQIREANDWT